MTEAMPNTPPAPPTTPEAATARLTELQGDAGWRDRLLSGGADEGREFRELSELASKADPVEAAMSGGVMGLEHGVIPNSQVRLMADVAADMKEAGLPEAAIRQALTGSPVSGEEHAAAVTWRNEFMSDKDRTAKYLAGDAAIAKQVRLANLIVASEIAK